MMRTEEAVSVDQTLYVHLLGGFSLYYGDNPVSFKRGVTNEINAASSDTASFW